MKAVLISIQPKWCELIANGKKTVEVRKTKPKLKTPFKVYIYCTQAKMPIRDNGRILMYEDDLAITNRWGQGKRVENPCGAMMDGELFLNGKVIGEFVCDTITEYECSAKGNGELATTCGTCLTYDEIINYCNGNELYGWHISDLVIYDKPKELSEFKSAATYGRKMRMQHFGKDPCCVNDYRLTRPPQSWCYVEEVK